MKLKQHRWLPVYNTLAYNFLTLRCCESDNLSSVTVLWIWYYVGILLWYCSILWANRGNSQAAKTVPCTALPWWDFQKVVVFIHSDSQYFQLRIRFSGSNPIINWVPSAHSLPSIIIHGTYFREKFSSNSCKDKGPWPLSSKCKTYCTSWHGSLELLCWSLHSYLLQSDQDILWS